MFQDIYIQKILLSLLLTIFCTKLVNTKLAFTNIIITYFSLYISQYHKSTLVLIRVSSKNLVGENFLGHQYSGAPDNLVLGYKAEIRLENRSMYKCNILVYYKIVLILNGIPLQEMLDVVNHNHYILCGSLIMLVLTGIIITIIF